MRMAYHLNPSSSKLSRCAATENMYTFIHLLWRMNVFDLTRHGLTVVTRSQSVVYVFLHLFQCQIKFTVPGSLTVEPVPDLNQYQTICCQIQKITANCYSVK